jgi:hypothetical protein
MMNAVHRRVLRAFIESGGDLTEALQVDHLVRYVETTMCLLPPKLRLALEISWELPEHVDYQVVATQLSTREGTEVTAVTARQRVSRAVRVLERWIRTGGWNVGSARLVRE